MALDKDGNARIEEYFERFEDLVRIACPRNPLPFTLLDGVKGLLKDLHEATLEAIEAEDDAAMRRAAKNAATYRSLPLN